MSNPHVRAFQADEMSDGAINSAHRDKTKLQDLETASIPTSRRASLAGHPVWLVAAFLLSALIAIAVVIRRSLALTHPGSARSPQLSAMDAAFASHRLLVCLHIYPAAAFVVLAAILLLSSSVSMLLRQLLYAFGVWTGITAYAMSSYAIGGVTEIMAVAVFNTLFLLELIRAWRLSQNKRWSEERVWLLRAVGVLLGIATTRPVMGAFFATQSRTRLQPEQFFGIAFWIGFSLNTIAVEFWLRFRRHVKST